MKKKPTCEDLEMEGACYTGTHCMITVVLLSAPCLLPSNHSVSPACTLSTVGMIIALWANR